MKTFRYSISAKISPSTPVLQPPYPSIFRLSVRTSVFRSGPPFVGAFCSGNVGSVFHFSISFALYPLFAKRKCLSEKRGRGRGPKSEGGMTVKSALFLPRPRLLSVSPFPVFFCNILFFPLHRSDLCQADPSAGRGNKTSVRRFRRRLRRPGHHHHGTPGGRRQRRRNGAGGGHGPRAEAPDAVAQQETQVQDAQVRRAFSTLQTMSDFISILYFSLSQASQPAAPVPRL